jgi:hypothetical protein
MGIQRSAGRLWPDWEQADIERVVAEGPHQSALDPENAETIKEDVQYQVGAEFSHVFP